MVDSLKQQLGLTELTVEYKLVTAENRFQLLQDGTVDLDCGITTYSLKRLADVDFSLLIFATGTDLMVRRDSQIAGVPDLGGKTIGEVEPGGQRDGLIAGADAQVGVLRRRVDNVARVE